MNNAQLIAKFWSRVRIPTHRYWRDRCWEWTGAVSKDDDKSRKQGWSGGHGVLKTGGKWKKAHRHIWELVHGPLKPGENVLHSCDIRHCVNVFKHLYVGTLGQNMQDVHDRGRATGGQKTGGHVAVEGPTAICPCGVVTPIPPIDGLVCCNGCGTVLAMVEWSGDTPVLQDPNPDTYEVPF